MTTCRDDGFFCFFYLFVRDVGDDEVLPDGEADFASAVLVGDVAEFIDGIDRGAAHWNDDADVVAFVLLLIDA